MGILNHWFDESVLKCYNMYSSLIIKGEKSEKVVCYFFGCGDAFFFQHVYCSCIGHTQTYWKFGECKKGVCKK